MAKRNATTGGSVRRNKTQRVIKWNEQGRRCVMMRLVISVIQETAPIKSLHTNRPLW